MDRAPTINPDIAETPAGQEPRTVSLVTPVHEFADGFPAEHIYIGDEASDSAGEPKTVVRRLRIRNPVRGTVFQLVFFEEGFLRFRERRGNSLAKDHLLELRFLNMEPQVTRQFDKLSLRAALVLGLVAALSWTLAPLTGLALPASLVGATGAVIALLLFVYRSDETYSFYTASGSAEVLTLRANFGCLGRIRKLVPQISRAIRNAVAGIRLDEETYLRAEMQAHYRLRESGVITRETCSDGVSMILSKFG